MSAKYTPGPWEWDISPVDYDPEQQTPWLLSAETAERPDCAILSGQIMCYSEADARLIAAAPDLLVALKALLFYADGMHRLQAHKDGDEVDYEAFPLARAAIEKATGVKP